MRILFISQELIGSGLCMRLVREGHEVKLFINDPDRKDCLEGFVEKTNSWKRELNWVGKDGVIVFDDVGFGKVQEELREAGHNVFGGNVEADRLELDRGYGQRIMHSYGIKILPSFNFKNVDSAIEFVKENPVKWVVKQSSHISSLNHVGELSDASDVLEVLQQYKEKKIKHIHLQKKAEGVEIGVARYFNGNDWIGPIEINHEHKRLEDGDTGPLTAEMGTIMWHTTDENHPLFEATLKKIKPYLQKIQYKGDIDINCIVTERDVWPLELTPRLGTPSTELQCELYESSMGEFVHAVASGNQVELKHKDEYGIVLSLGLPPFPFPPQKGKRKKKYTIKHDLKKHHEPSIHFEEVSKRKAGDGEELYWAGSYGYLGYITASAKSVPEAKQKAMNILRKFDVPDLIHRTDIGDRVHKHDLKMLKKWGWI